MRVPPSAIIDTNVLVAGISTDNPRSANATVVDRLFAGRFVHFASFVPDFSKPLAFTWREMTPDQTRKAGVRAARKREAEKDRDVAADVADVPAQQLTVADDEQMRYRLLGPRDRRAVPEAGFKLLVVIPGGYGYQQSFVRRIYKDALSDDFLLAQPVPVIWPDDPETVWPTDQDRIAGKRFSTEEFIEAVIRDVSRRQPIDMRYILIMSWSSGGPAAYATALRVSTLVRGSYIVMSAYRAEWRLPSDRAKGRTFLIAHSPDDTVCPFEDAESAERDLHEAGAAVRLAKYAGGNGWHGGNYPGIGSAIAWIVDQIGAEKNIR